MSNISLPITKSLLSIDLKRGDIVDARGQIGVVYDVLRSADTDTVFVLMMFVHNIGNARQYDILEFTPSRAAVFQANTWRKVGTAELEEALDNRRRSLEKSIGDVLAVANQVEVITT